MTKQKNYDFDKNQHAVYSLSYHLVVCVKYRKKVLIDKLIINDLKEQIYKISELYDVRINEMETDEDHIHILFSAKPQTDLIKYIQYIKGSTSRKLRELHKEKLHKDLWGDNFWSRSYCLITTGQVTLEAVKKYIQNQGFSKK